MIQKAIWFTAYYFGVALFAVVVGGMDNLQNNKIKDNAMNEKQEVYDIVSDDKEVQALYVIGQVLHRHLADMCVIDQTPVHRVLEYWLKRVNRTSDSLEKNKFKLLRSEPHKEQV